MSVAELVEREAHRLAVQAWGRRPRRERIIGLPRVEATDVERSAAAAWCGETFARVRELWPSSWGEASDDAIAAEILRRIEAGSVVSFLVGNPDRS